MAAYAAAVRIYEARFPGRPRPFITSGYRTVAEQEALYRQGKTPVRGGYSNHNRRRAIDVGFRDQRGRYQWDEQYFRDFAAIIREVDDGVTWGGTWRTPDWVHFEISARRGEPGRPNPITLPGVSTGPTPIQLPGVTVTVGPAPKLSDGARRFLLLFVATILCLYAVKAMND